MECTAEFVLCVFCNKQMAFLYRRADSANLCLLCDRHVHSSNAISCRHLRLLICDNCGSTDVSVRCVTENLFLCRECDCDAHRSCAVPATHSRIPVVGVSGCPTAIELASAWGLEFKDRRPKVPAYSILPPNPNNSPVIYSNSRTDQKQQELMKQLVGLQDGDLEDAHGGSSGSDELGWRSGC